MGIYNRLHDSTVRRVLGTSIDFFEKNTQGRILNRFSKDVETMDNLVFLFLEMIDYIVKCFFSIGIVVFLSPWIVILALGSLCYLLRLRRMCLLVTRDTIRLKF